MRCVAPGGMNSGAEPPTPPAPLTGALRAPGFAIGASKPPGPWLTPSPLTPPGSSIGTFKPHGTRLSSPSPLTPPGSSIGTFKPPGTRLSSTPLTPPGSSTGTFKPHGSRSSPSPLTLPSGSIGTFKPYVPARHSSCPQSPTHSRSSALVGPRSPLYWLALALAASRLNRTFFLAVHATSAPSLHRLSLPDRGGVLKSCGGGSPTPYGRVHMEMVWSPPHLKHRWACGQLLILQPNLSFPVRRPPFLKRSLYQ